MHSEEFHCKAIGEMHFHEQHHDCTFCNVVLPVASAPSKAQVHFSPFHFAEYVFPVFIQDTISPFYFFSSQLRAPPALS